MFKSFKQISVKGSENIEKKFFFEKKYGKYQKFYEEFHELNENFVR